ncbi:hypothetical protein ACJJTC_013612 [Scirpophaga incertulas]
MDLRILMVLTAAVLAVFLQRSYAEFYFNRVYLKGDKKQPQNMKCKPGRTIIKVAENLEEIDDDDDDDYENSRRTHMNSGIKEEHCLICMCSLDGMNESCIGRPARTVNECIMMSRIRNSFNKRLPFEHTKDLAYRIRRVGTHAKSVKCIPYVSQYTDCTDANICSSCRTCICSGKGEWVCEILRQCPMVKSSAVSDVDDDMMDEAMNEIVEGLQEETRNEMLNAKTLLVPRPPSKDDDLLLGDGRGQLKRKNQKYQREFKFYHTVDEIDEDTLKNDNTTGTLQAKKLSNLSKTSRRSDSITNDMVPQNDSLHIVFNDPKQYDSHIAENKIDTSKHLDDEVDTFLNHHIQGIVGNQTKKQKDKQLSKLIVNELKNGTETVGDVNAPIISGIWKKIQVTSPEEIEKLKQQKITDLLELFKEPLNLRQENFLKNALQHLSEAIDKDKINKNISICDTILSPEGALRGVNYSDDKTVDKCNKSSHFDDNKVPEDSNTSTETQYVTTAKAILKINDALNLINKYQQVHTKLNKLKRKQESDKQIKSKTTLNDNETTSLNVFGKILEKVTKLLLPPKKSNKMIKNINNHNILSSTNKELPKFIHSSDMINLTTKDKIVLDYLNLVKNHPKCVMNLLKDVTTSHTEIEGDILLNLTEFFKIKSLVDLIRLLEPENFNFLSTSKKPQTKMTAATESTTTTITTTVTIKKRSENFISTKAKLKAHLMSIINDLKELQEAKGDPVSNFSLADTLPCIYNLINSDNQLTNKAIDHISTSLQSPSDKIIKIFKSLKNDLRSVPFRRSNVLSYLRPKSAIVWERIIKNVNDKVRKHTRRTYNSTGKPFEKLRKEIDMIEEGSKTYKNYILINGVKPEKQLTLLKTLNVETNNIISTLEDISVLFENYNDLTVEQKNEVTDFIYNAAMNINLNSNIHEILNRTKFKSKVQKDADFTKIINNNFKASYSNSQKSLGMSDVLPVITEKIKLTRNDIINQLIRNRMMHYITEKESKDINFNDDINYRIAKKILLNLEIGNEGLAKEMYKYMIMKKEKLRDDRLPSYEASVSSLIGDNYNRSPFEKKPLLEAQQGPNTNDLSNQQSWLRQLINLKNI